MCTKYYTSSYLHPMRFLKPLTQWIHKQKLETKANETLLNVQIVFVYNAPPTILNQNRFDVQMWTYVELKRKYLVNQLQFCPLRYVVE